MSKKEMKKLVVMLFAILGLSTIVSAADYCKINGAYGTVSVNNASVKDLQETSSFGYRKYMLSFSLSNSSEHKVNVSYNATGIPSYSNFERGEKSASISISAGSSEHICIIFWAKETPSTDVNVYGADCVN